MRKKIFTSKVLKIGGLCILCAAIITSVLYWKTTNTSNFTPEADTGVETNSEWTAPTSNPPAAEDSQKPTDEPTTATDGTQENASDNYQVVSESEDEVIINMTPPAKKTTPKDPAPPADKAVTNNPTPNAPATSGNGATSKPKQTPKPEQPGKVYDPVFGWTDLAPVETQEVDSTGDPDKMIGDMG